MFYLSSDGRELVGAHARSTVVASSIFFLYAKVFIEEPAHTDHVNIVTAASGPWPEALALVLPDSELPAF
jgi:hypothetical protein